MTFAQVIDLIKKSFGVEHVYTEYASDMIFDVGLHKLQIFDTQTPNNTRARIVSIVPRNTPVKETA